MRLVLDITTEAQKKEVIQLAQQLNIAIGVLQLTEDEEDAAMVRAIYAGAQEDVLSDEEKADFLAYLAK